MPSIYENEHRQKRCQGQPHMKHGTDTNLTSPAQGQKTPPKLLPRSKQQIFVGYNDGSKSIKYYNPETQKVLTSRNYVSLKPSQPTGDARIHTSRTSFCCAV